MAMLELTRPKTRTVRTICSLCKVICPAVITVEGETPVRLEPDRAHSRGGAVCAKGRAAPDLHDHPHRVNYPVRRTRPKTDPDPGWERCSWDEALDLAAEQMLRIRERYGPAAILDWMADSGTDDTFVREATRQMRGVRRRIATGCRRRD